MGFASWRQWCEIHADAIEPGGLSRREAEDCLIDFDRSSAVLVGESEGRWELHELPQAASLGMFEYATALADDANAVEGDRRVVMLAFVVVSAEGAAWGMCDDGAVGRECSVVAFFVVRVGRQDRVDPCGVDAQCRWA